MKSINVADMAIQAKTGAAAFQKQIEKSLGERVMTELLKGVKVTISMVGDEIIFETHSC